MRQSTQLTIGIGLLLLTACSAVAQEDLVIADFERESYEPWTVTGECFGSGPASGTLPGQMHVDGYQGQRLVNSYFKGDGTTGTLTSPEFTIERQFIAFMIGGGHQPEKLALQLLVGDQIARASTGSNSQPGGSETLTQDYWDVSEWKGKVARLRIIDQAQGGWGHINVDHIVQTDKKPRGLQTNVERSMVVQSKYLAIPIRNGAPKRVLTVLLNDQRLVRNDIEMADGPVDWWATMDVSPWSGQTLTLRVDKLPEQSEALNAIYLSDRVPNSGNLYAEPSRAQFHFSPQRGWNNDPNGLVYFKDEYHLFFQHNPYGWGWGNMHWGHAVSRDLVHWQELGDTLWPDDLGPMFSGSAVVDWQNTSGLGKDGQPPLVLIYTAAGNPTVQCLAYSLDGRTFVKYAGNPVLTQITGGNRDPKVFWHEPTKKWIMVLYVEWDKRHTIHFFTSDDLKAWKLASITPGDAPGKPYLFECPDFFELPIDGDATRKQWVLTAANSAYAVGGFNGERFESEQSNLRGHSGRGFYAAQTFSDLPPSDGRRIQIGWFQTETRGESFNQSMTIPLELKLTNTTNGPRLTYSPVKELESLRAKTHQIAPLTLDSGTEKLIRIDSPLLEVRTEFEPAAGSRFELKLHGVNIEYIAESQELKIGDWKAPAPLRAGKQRFCIYVDRTGLEIFASDGLCYVPWPHNFKSDDPLIAVRSHDGHTIVHQFNIYELNSAWHRQ